MRKAGSRTFDGLAGAGGVRLAPPAPANTIFVILFFKDFFILPDRTSPGRLFSGAAIRCPLPGYLKLVWVSH